MGFANSNVGVSGGWYGSVDVSWTVANTTLVAEAGGSRLEQTLQPTAQTSGARTVVSTSYDTAGNRVAVVTSTTSADGAAITNALTIMATGWWTYRNWARAA